MVRTMELLKGSNISGRTHTLGSTLMLCHFFSCAPNHGLFAKVSPLFSLFRFAFRERACSSSEKVDKVEVIRPATAPLPSKAPGLSKPAACTHGLSLHTMHTPVFIYSWDDRQESKGCDQDVGQANCSR
jgi:hypothetical protein